MMTRKARAISTLSEAEIDRIVIAQADDESAWEDPVRVKRSGSSHTLIQWHIWKARARALKREVYALPLAARDPRTPFYAKLFAGLVAAYAFSPIDLIPDFIPVLGYLDDLILIPLGVMLAVRLIPPQVLEDSRAQADALMAQGKPISWLGALIIGAVWIGLVGLGVALIVRWIG
jgi:uncharacterized membrane protein YkvA (DUF1232 family)